MPDASDRSEDHDPFVYGVRPEPPHFEELARRPDPVEPYSHALYPPGQIRRAVGPRRSRILLRTALIIVLAVALVVFMR